MNHLNAGELVDLIERSPDLPLARHRHAETCARCRAKADELRSTLTRAATEDVPAPSPLFWDHLSARVAESIRDARFDDARVGGGRWWVGARPRWTAMLATAALVTSIVVWRATVYAPVPVPRSDAAASHLDEPASIDPPTSMDQAANADDDAAWAVVRAAADDLPWEDAHAAGLSARPGAAEGLALEMTVEERQELARLLGQELKRNGV